MKRRNFIAGAIGAALPTFSVNAQRSQRNAPLVGVIWIGTASAQFRSGSGRPFYGDFVSTVKVSISPLSTDILVMGRAR